MDAEKATGGRRTIMLRSSIFVPPVISYLDGWNTSYISIVQPDPISPCFLESGIAGWEFSGDSRDTNNLRREKDDHSEDGNTPSCAYRHWSTVTNRT